VGVMCWVVSGRVRPRRHENRRLLCVRGRGRKQLRHRRCIRLRWVESMRRCRRLVRLVMVWWWQGPKLTRILEFHDMVHGHACCLRFLLRLPLQFHFDRRGALVRVVLGINSMELAEKPLTTGPLRRIMLLRLRPLLCLYPPLCPPPRCWFWSGGADTLLI
jgi:hypothetical protein